MKKISMLHENDKVKIFIRGIKNMENISIGVAGRNLVIWAKKLQTIRLPYKAEITRKMYENGGLKIILKRQ